MQSYDEIINFLQNIPELLKVQKHGSFKPVILEAVKVITTNFLNQKPLYSPSGFYTRLEMIKETLFILREMRYKSLGLGLYQGGSAKDTLPSSLSEAEIRIFKNALHAMNKRRHMSASQEEIKIREDVIDFFHLEVEKVQSDQKKAELLTVISKAQKEILDYQKIQESDAKLALLEKYSSIENLTGTARSILTTLYNMINNYYQSTWSYVFPKANEEVMLPLIEEWQKEFAQVDDKELSSDAYCDFTRGIHIDGQHCDQKDIRSALLKLAAKVTHDFAMQEKYVQWLGKFGGQSILSFLCDLLFNDKLLGEALRIYDCPRLINWIAKKDRIHLVGKLIVNCFTKLGKVSDIFYVRDDSFKAGIKEINPMEYDAYVKKSEVKPIMEFNFDIELNININGTIYPKVLDLQVENYNSFFEKPNIIIKIDESRTLRM